jgi:hypothetical protein
MAPQYKDSTPKAPSVHSIQARFPWKIGPFPIPFTFAQYWQLLLDGDFLRRKAKKRCLHDIQRHGTIGKTFRIFHARRVYWSERHPTMRILDMLTDG